MKKRKQAVGIRYSWWREQFYRVNAYCNLVRGITKHPRSVPLIISLTSIPERLNTLHICIESLLKQTLKPDHIVLWLADSIIESQIPLILSKQKKRGLQIESCKDIGPYTKILYTLKKYPEGIIVTADDDVIYPQHWLKLLYESYQEEPDYIHCHRGFLMIVDAYGKLEKLSDWPDKGEGIPGPSLFLFPEGVSGILYPPGSLPEEVFNEDVFLQICPTNDDIWLRTMSMLNGKLCKKVSPFSKFFFFIKGTQERALWRTNNKMNEPQTQAVFQYYDIYRLIAEKHPLAQYFRSEPIQESATLNQRLEYLASGQKIWRHVQTGECDQIVSTLRQSLTYTPYPSTEETVFSLAAQFGRWCIAEDQNTEILQVLWPHFRTVVLDSITSWESLERLLRWWTSKLPGIKVREPWELQNVWQCLLIVLQYEKSLGIPAEDILDWWLALKYQYWCYGKNPPADLPWFVGFQSLTPVQLVELVQQLLSVSYGTIEAKQIKRFWNDLLGSGVIRKLHYHNVIALYLTVFGQAVLRRRWWRAVGGLHAALIMSWHPRVWPAWGRFFSNARNYFSKRRSQ